MERYIVAAATAATTTTINGGGAIPQQPTITTTIHSSSPFISLQPKPNLSHLHTPRRLLLADTELSIFDAERYFNDSNNNNSSNNNNNRSSNAIVRNQSCDLSTNPRDSSVSSVDAFPRNYRNFPFIATPTASSEASWNSQSGLLSNPPGAAAAAKLSARPPPSAQHRKAPPFSPRRRFPHHCPCSGKKSIDVEEKYSEPKSPIISSAALKQSPRPNATTAEAEAKMQILAGNWANESEVFHPSGRFSTESPFPARRILDSGGFSFPILKPLASLDDPARDSLEVFRPNRRGYTFPASPRGPEDDVGSDASSDLFELESFSAYKRRDSLDEVAAAGRFSHLRRSIEMAAAAASAASETSEAYAPSEVSVEWSVTTAEGFDRASAANFSSAASDYDENRFVRAGATDRTAGKLGGKGLLSCVCEKAVSVGPGPVHYGPQPQQRTVPVGFGPGDVDRVHGVAKLGNGSLVRSNSARMYRPMATR